MSRFYLIAILGSIGLGISNANQLFAQNFVANYDESKIAPYTLPDPLITEDGDKVTDAKTWSRMRRPELLELFATQVYGTAPEPCKLTHRLISTHENAVQGKAIRREVDVHFGSSADAPAMRLLIYTPKSADGAVPAFLTLNFQGNHSVDPDPTISLNASWMRSKKGMVVENRATEAARGVAASRWPIEMIVDRGYALVTIYYGDIDPDFDDGFENGIHGHLKSEAESIPAKQRWGSIAGWAYGLSRALDYLETDERIDGSSVAVFGHSRLGKTALWAGASDPRFKMVISNNSGCGGAALSRRAIGETIGRINSSFPHWFCDNYLQFNENESACPVDQHQLIALIAPRAVYVASATEDRWADPKGEFLSMVKADPVYRLLGTDGMGSDQAPAKMPAPDNAIKTGTMGYHLRTGKHNVTDYDWNQYLDFADKHL
ncbi:MAG: acetylxylan esterase [Planctomycetota bacterium]